MYDADDEREGRPVAIKVLHPRYATDANAHARFAQEAAVAGSFGHPNIVAVYDVGALDAGVPFMVMERLRGETVTRRLQRERPLSVALALEVARQVLNALIASHARGVLHRDLKPDNLMLQTGGVLKLTDFGIAHVADQREMTATGQVLGSPAHMAPEQIEGTSVDARTDLFAAGTVLYFLATARLPFDGPNAHSLLRKILDGEYLDPQRVAPKVGHRFAAIIKRALEKDPANRYPDAAAMRADLMAFLADVGWTLPDRELQRYFADPDGVLDALRETLRVSGRDEAFCERVVRWLTDMPEAPEARGFLDEAAGAYAPVEARTAALAARYVVRDGAAWCELADETPRDFDKTELLLAGQRLATVAVVVDAQNVTLAAPFDSGVNFLTMLGIDGGMPTVVSVPRGRLDEVRAALRRRAQASPAGG